MPFKSGAAKMAVEANATIVPFVITGEYKLFKKSVRIEFLKPIKVDEVDKTNERLMEAVKNGIIKNGGKNGKRK
jgi:1-acyl-sn-glycerol-3-phosphate acyltransferase